MGEKAEQREGKIYINGVYIGTAKINEPREEKKMDKTEIQERINKLKSVQRGLEKQLEDLEKGYPEVGTAYYYIDYSGSVKRDEFSHFISDKNIFDVGNYFKTEKEAEFEVNKRKLLAEIERFRQAEEGKGKPYFGLYGNTKYKIAYGWVEGSLVLVENSTLQDITSLYFIKSETANKVIDKFGDRIIKMIKGEL